METLGTASFSFSFNPRRNQPSAQERRAALAEVKSKIALHKKSIEVLEREQEELEKGLSFVVYPVLTLPFDITSRIFLHCLPSHGRVAPSPSKAPLLLAQICHHWREVALSTCGLWKSLYIDPGIDVNMLLGNRTVPLDQRLQTLIQTWFSRAKKSPLSLGLNFQSRMVSPAFMDIVLSYAGQLERLDLHLWTEQFRTFRPLRASFPLLQHLATTHSSEPEVLNLLEACSSIRGLRLLGDLDHDVSVNLSLPCLTHLEISTEISTETFLAILGNFPALSHFKFCLRESDSYLIPDASPPITYPRLSSLALGSSESVSVLRLVTLPSLRFLQIPRFCDPADVRDLISRSSCTIDHLIISFERLDADEDNGESGDWLKIFSSISVLEVTECPDLALLIDYLDSSSLVPRLTDISIRSHITRANIDSNYDDALVEMLHHRRQPLRAATLRRLHVKFTILHGGEPDIDSQVWCPGYLAALALEKLIAEGLDLGFRLESSVKGSYFWPATYVAPETEPQFP